MSVYFEHDPADLDHWLIAEADGKPQVGAYMPAYEEGDLTVYWRGDVATVKLRQIVEQAEKALAGTDGHVEGILIAYGKSRECVRTEARGLSAYLAPSSFLHGFAASMMPPKWPPARSRWRA